MANNIINVMSEKAVLTILITKTQSDKLREESQRTGNSQNSIIRSAIESYFLYRNGAGLHND
jgi:hypothetical protein